jgi:hypothetical protein
MISKCGTFLAALCIPCFVSAQDYTRPITEQRGSGNFYDSKKLSLAFSAGAAIPLLDFGSSNVKNSFWDFNSPDSTRLQGFAKTGFHFDLTASYLLNDNAGIMVMIGGNTNPIDFNGIETALGYPASATITSYYTGEYLLGPYLHFKLTDKFNFDLGIMAGIISNNYPTISLAFSDTTTYTRDIANGKLSFGYSLYTALNYQLSDNIDLRFSLAFTGGTIYYPNWIESLTLTVPGYYPVTGSYDHSTDETSMQMGILKASVGLAFKF